MAPTGGSSGGGGGGGGNIKVVVRVRPFNNRENERNAKCIVQMQGAQTVLQPDAEERLKKGGKGGEHTQKTFKFDKSYWSFNKSDPNYAGQDNLFNDLGVPLLDNAFQGYNNCIFAYGQTGSGKSYSMMGYGEDAGVIPRICREMFERIKGVQTDPHLTCTVEVSYLEIYNERVRDLLNPATKGNLRVREHPSTGPYVEDLAKLAVRSFQEIENLMDEGNKARTVAATNMNETSSRSHAVFTLTLTQKRHDAETSMDTEKVAKISLVDLAGSERATSTGATGARLKEGAEINRSLSTLGRVIAALADLSSGKKGLKVPYRDSVLTWLLKDSLGGNSLTAMIAAISPADINFEETLSTLRYADSAKRIKNHAVINEDPNARMIRELKEELAKLRSQLGGGPAGVGEEIYPPDTPLDKQMVSMVQADGSIKKVSKAEIMDQLNQSEKLYKDLNQTWEEKLQNTEQIHKEREAALEELGISIEKGNVGMSTPKKMPHLVNLSDDPLLAECLVYNLKPGITTVGNVDSETASEIRLNGSKILEHHCRLENVENVVTIIPNENAAVMVNGIRVDKAKRLKSGNRIILGDFHIFRFNNPLEAKAERAERSLLRHSVTASQMNSPSPTPFRPGHERSWSAAGSEFDGDSSRAQSPGLSNRDSDWSFARREAAGALLGTDQKITQLTDEELDNLLENIQRAREERRGRPENRIGELDDDSDDLSSFLVRDKYMSGGTTDNFSLDTALTMPATPSTHMGSQEGEPTLTQAEFVQEAQQAERAKADDEQAASERAERQAEQEAKTSQMQQQLDQAKQEFQEELRKQKEAFEEQIKQMDLEVRTQKAARTPAGFIPLTTAEVAIARNVIDKWQQRNYILIAESILQTSGLLKEAQVMSKLLEQDTHFQFVILDLGQERGSSYDLILHDISIDEDDALANAHKPCLAIRVIDSELGCIHLWSLEKLRLRVAKMRQMHQFKNQPEYLQHFRMDNPFRDSDQPLFSLVGDGSIPLTAVFETRVQDFVVEISSPSTRQVVGRVRLSLEPSLAESPPSSIKFNIIMRDLAGFAEHEGTQVHAQMTVLGTPDESVATTQPITNFGDGPIRFESIHHLSVASSGEKSAIMKIAIFAQVSSTHLDKLISWDELREMNGHFQDEHAGARISDSEYNLEERHDVFARVQVLELAENGQYLPVEVVQNNADDIGAFQLHQGLQRRISVSMTHSFTEGLPWDDVKALRIGGVHLIDSSGRVADLGSTTPDIPLKRIQEPMIRDNADGTSNITIVGQWDSSLHKSLLLDRVTNEQSRIQIVLCWDVISSRLEQAMTFCIEQQLQILPRSYVRPQSMFKSFWNQTRITHSTDGIFSIVVRPVSAKRAADLWRLDTSKNYINGEELLGNWKPRGVSLVKDYLVGRRKRRQLQDIESAKAALGLRRLSISKMRSRAASPSNIDAREEQLLRKFLAIWQKRSIELSNPIFDDEVHGCKTDTPPARSLDESSSQRKIRYLASVTAVMKNPVSLKSGYLLMPSEDYPPSPTSSSSTGSSMQWKRRFIDLRPPYLYVHSVPNGEAINAINLTNARIDHDPDFKRLLGSSSISTGDSLDRNPGNGHRRTGSSDLHHGLAHVFAVYGEQNTFLFAARSESQKLEWIFKMDSYFGQDGVAEEDTSTDLGHQG
ncbi:kinesin family member 1/13/14 [Exophiala aquamarina CBS 119918]|uniref:Kinesin family member 1/13/14 n=1 Tax=Exophiala aquamarina CBS 119918 TaxID=1182545 RepID=A0A072PU42_9EURO|nr:kinesin family member 1/13/14 [Exophiala aquamarina CBS 119918]KEF63366.1 kinesin family member 1/13/14 [Exophiala aquamarina CBS 119918]